VGEKTIFLKEQATEQIQKRLMRGVQKWIRSGSGDQTKESSEGERGKFPIQGPVAASRALKNDNRSSGLSYYKLCETV